MMKKLVYLISAVAALAGFPSRAATLNEWNFYSDPSGKTLANAVNSSGSAVFSSGGSGFVETDGFGNLLCTQNDPGTTGMWTNGFFLNASVPDSSGIQYMRYDFSYDLSDTNNLNDSGTIVGFSFYDSTSNKLAGVALQYDIGASTSLTYQVSPIVELTNTAGTVAVVARINPASHTLAVWYNLNGDVSGFSESSPNTVVSNLSLLSFNALRFQSTGDIRPSGSTDEVAVNLLRTADSWSDIAASESSAPPAKYSNEWNFERDQNGRSLSDAINSGSNSPPAQFSAGYGSTVFTTNRALLCIGNDAGTDGVWTNGAILDAALPSATSGVHYLRYDVVYSLTNSLNDSGTLLGVYFTDTTGDRAAGLVLGYDTGTLTGAVPANRILTSITNGLDPSGTLTAIAEVNLDTDTLRVWYDLSGSNTFNTNTPAFSTNITLSTIDNLRFHATGDFRPAGSTDYATIDNIRHTASLSEIIDPPADLTAQPELSVSVSDSAGGAMDIGETNTVTVVIANSGGAATNVTSVLSHDGNPAGFTVVSNNTPVPIGANTSITNIYTLTAVTNGSYNFTVTAFTGTNSVATNFSVVVGSQISYLSNSITEFSGGIISNKYEPGETLKITVTSINNGARTVNNITNTLSAGSNFSITPSSAVYPSLTAGSSTSTVYTVVISGSTPAGTNHVFSVTNRTGSMTWSDSFTLDIFSDAIPSVTTNALTIRVASGEIGTGAVTLTNAGNTGISYTVTDDNLRPVSAYMVKTQNVDRISLAMGALFTNWSGNLDIGFNMPVFSTHYSTFSASRDGTLTLTSTNGATAVLKVFKSSTAVDTNTVVHFLQSTNRLTVSWDNGTVPEFQAWLNADGTIQYLYQYGIWGEGTIGLSAAGYNQTLNHTPGLTGRDSLLLTPSPWITYSPSSGNISGQNSGLLTFTANATGQRTGTNTFDVTVDWENAAESVIHVTVIVETANPALRILSPQPFNFFGSAGSISRTNMVVTNNGNVTLNYVITDSGIQAAGYTATNTAYSWTDIPKTASFILNDAQLGISSLNLGFPFVFFGNVYTTVTVNANGTLALGSQQSIAPFSAVSYSGSSSVRAMADVGQTKFTVTWENVAQSSDGSNQTFQAVLNRDGTINFNYQKITGVWTNGIVQISDTAGDITTNLINDSTRTVQTNITRETVSTTNWFHGVPLVSNTVIYTTNVTIRYADAASRQTLKFIPGKQRIISASPISGVLPVGVATNITITGDARTLEAGAPAYSVTNNTTLAFSYSSKSTNVLVSFIATNSADMAYGAIAGTDDFTASVVQNADGSRLISWPAATDGTGDLSRRYVVYFTTNLMGSWEQIYEGWNVYSYLDTAHADEPVIYYKLTVE